MIHILNLVISKQSCYTCWHFSNLSDNFPCNQNMLTCCFSHWNSFFSPIPSFCLSFPYSFSLSLSHFLFQFNLSLLILSFSVSSLLSVYPFLVHFLFFFLIPSFCLSYPWFFSFFPQFLLSNYPLLIYYLFYLPFLPSLLVFPIPFFCLSYLCFLCFSLPFLLSVYPSLIFFNFSFPFLLSVVLLLFILSLYSLSVCPSIHFVTPFHWISDGYLSGWMHMVFLYNLWTLKNGGKGSWLFYHTCTIQIKYVSAFRNFLVNFFFHFLDTNLMKAWQQMFSNSYIPVSSVEDWLPLFCVTNFLKSFLL